MLLSHKDHHIAPRFGRRVDWHGTGLGRGAWIGIAIVVAAVPVEVLMTTTNAWSITSFVRSSTASSSSVAVAAGRIGDWRNVLALASGPANGSTGPGNAGRFVVLLLL
jgi:hypothetical protein